MAIPLYIFLFLYFLFLAVFITFSIIHVYHIVATASLTFASLTVTFIISVLTVVTLFWTIQALQGVDFTQTISVFGGQWFGGGSNEPLPFAPVEF